ncbi:hypothetical protein AUR64_07655 [Haloprofundus marisrubri]|uniref:NrS-1 polymerase-like HBD domain-containing protein n=1 Tax=Haloprofundus marisrubri TaxID=1514971 RepID=A0A0W1RC39_9EURY|nr:hypothetical protein [Haloprofundus marisrubri]KTG11031.1 hypothetical protein AUR64_07655 [Haloprofundus marisrubri]
MTTVELPSRAGLPEALVARDQWVCWREESRSGKPTKIPVNPETKRYASTTDPDTWASFDVAHETATEKSGYGLGFVFTAADSLVGVDLDDCRDSETGEATGWATEIVDTLDSYTEVSPSGTGYHVIVHGKLPGDRNRSGDVELYENARFFTVTGDHVEETPTEVCERDEELSVVHEAYVGSTTISSAEDDHSDTQNQDDDSEAVKRSESGSDDSASSTLSSPSGSVIDLDDETLLQKARSAGNGEKFGRLWRGDTSGYESQSEADFALCSLLAFWTGGDEHRVDRLFRDSGLMREKWDERHFADGSTYGKKTVERAVSGTSEFYSPQTTTEQSELQSTETATTSSPSPNGNQNAGAVSKSPASSTHLENVREREQARLETITELEQVVQRLRGEIETLETELEAERSRRRALEQETESSTGTSESFFAVFQSVLPWN